jgi:hypothetical protein
MRCGTAAVAGHRAPSVRSYEWGKPPARVGYATPGTDGHEAPCGSRRIAGKRRETPA